MTVLIALLHKGPTTDRSIGLVPDIIRLWSAARKVYPTEWVDQVAGKWDKAVRGSSCLRVGMLRAFMD
eukprot:6552579-Pyramimonas_sp.AAC.1